MLTLVALALAVERRREVETYDLRGPSDAVSRLTEQLENLGLTVNQYGTSMHLERDFTTHAAGASHKKTHSHARGHAHSAGPRLGAHRREVASELNKLEEDLEEDLRSMEQLEKGSYYDGLSAADKALLPTYDSTMPDKNVKAKLARIRANKADEARPGVPEWQGAAERLGYTITWDIQNTPFESDIGLQAAVSAGVQRRHAVRLGDAGNIACDLVQILDAGIKAEKEALRKASRWWMVDAGTKFLKAGIGVMLFVFGLTGVIACPWLAFAIGVGVLVVFAAWDARQQYLKDKNLAASVGSFFFNVVKGATLSALGVDVLKEVADGFQNVVAVVDMVCGARSDVIGKAEDWTNEAVEFLDKKDKNSDDGWRFDGMTIPAGPHINAEMKETLEQLVKEGKLKKVSPTDSAAADSEVVQGRKKGSDIKAEMIKEPGYKRAFDQAKQETLEWFECSTFFAFGGSD